MDFSNKFSIQLTPKQKQDIITKIRQSNTFGKATTSSALLQYLFDATLNGTNLKEGVIDIDFYGSKEVEEKNNPRVRVNVYNLRKKLLSYYEHEGKNDTWQLRIDKGQYQVSFVRKHTRKRLVKRFKWSIIIPYTALIIAVIVIIQTTIPPKAPALWQNFFDKNASTNLFIGDAFGFVGETILGRKGWTQDYGINNIEEFYNYIDDKPELKNSIRPAKFTFATGMAGISVQHFQRFFQNHQKAFSIRYSSRSSVAEISETNAMYIGTFHNNNKFTNFFNNANPYFKITDTRLLLSNHPQIRDTSYNIFIPGEFQEYAVVSKYPATGNTEHFVFFSQHDIGVSATVDYFTNVDSVRSFERKYLEGKKYFTAVFNVKGQDRTDTDIALELVVNY